MGFSLSTRERRLVALALSYHLGRPGSELDPATRLPLEHGLRELEVSIRAHGDGPEREQRAFEVDEWQFDRLQSAMKGCITELRVHHLREGAASTVEGWSATAVQLFPELKEPEAGLDIAEEMMMLSRRLASAAKAAT